MVVRGLLVGLVIGLVVEVGFAVVALLFHGHYSLSDAGWQLGLFAAMSAGSDAGMERHRRRQPLARPTAVDYYGEAGRRLMPGVTDDADRRDEHHDEKP
ncbi:hypothetical protein [Frankia canadensis]|uniref:hypothetical protein n=1 Tax=Frankia canadensis TaxID=1836972 RepID=UPI0010557BA4|nr:hypothetical protein [Frankia canadensis]